MFFDRQETREIIKLNLVNLIEYEGTYESQEN
jgi:hypothetical protein